MPHHAAQVCHLIRELFHRGNHGKSLMRVIDFKGVIKPALLKRNAGKLNVLLEIFEPLPKLNHVIYGPSVQRLFFTLANIYLKVRGSWCESKLARATPAVNGLDLQSSHLVDERQVREVH